PMSTSPAWSTRSCDGLKTWRCVAPSRKANTITPVRSWSFSSLSAWPTTAGPTVTSWTRVAPGSRSIASRRSTTFGRTIAEARRRAPIVAMETTGPARPEQLPRDVSPRLPAAADDDVVPQRCDLSLHPSLLPSVHKVTLDPERGKRADPVHEAPAAVDDERDREPAAGPRQRMDLLEAHRGHAGDG